MKTAKALGLTIPQPLLLRADEVIQQMDRRTFLSSIACAILAAPLAGGAEDTRHIPRIGVLTAVNVDAATPFVDAFREGLRNVGYVEGQNIAIDWRYAAGRAEQFSELARELVQLNADVIVAANNEAAEALQRVTRTTPIVVVLASDPVGRGFVVSLARPGGNMTGFSSQIPEVIGKRLQLLREAAPTFSKVAVLGDPTFSGTHQQVGQAEIAAKALGIRVQRVEARSANDFESVFASMVQQEAGATLLIGSSMHYVHRARLCELAKKSHLPSVCPLRGFVEAGCLMSYAPSFSDLWRRSAVYVGKILKGAKPAELPMEQPTKFELVINLKTAKALGLTIPQSLLLRADEVIE